AFANPARTGCASRARHMSAISMPPSALPMLNSMSRNPASVAYRSPPGLPGHRRAPAAQDRRDLDRRRAGGARERARVAAEEQVGEADQRSTQILQVGVQLVALRVPDEQRPGQVPAEVEAVEQAGLRHSAAQLTGASALPADLFEVTCGELRAARCINSWGGSVTGRSHAGPPCSTRSRSAARSTLPWAFLGSSATTSS